MAASVALFGGSAPHPVSAAHALLHRPCIIRHICITHAHVFQISLIMTPASACRYLIIKLFPNLNLQTFFNLYFWLIGSVAVAGNVLPPLRRLVRLCPPLTGIFLGFCSNLRQGCTLHLVVCIRVLHAKMFHEDREAMYCGRVLGWSAVLLGTLSCLDCHSGGPAGRGQPQHHISRRLVPG